MGVTFFRSVGVGPYRLSRLTKILHFLKSVSLGLSLSFLFFPALIGFEL